jgi:uncharacterized SAM-binding protein YcdF (DUF218 family)
MPILRRIILWTGLALFFWCAALALRIDAVGRNVPQGRADVAIVLGAAAYDSRPSPVFAARIDHGIALFRAGRVRRLLFTGGHGTGARFAESQVARRYAMARGVPASAILIETRSRTTRQNLDEAAALMRNHRLTNAFIVSDPAHLMRAGWMADAAGIDAQAAATPTTRYRGWQARTGFAMREIWFATVFLLSGK